jgi:hypothetical protein
MGIQAEFPIFQVDTIGAIDTAHKDPLIMVSLYPEPGLFRRGHYEIRFQAQGPGGRSPEEILRPAGFTEFR